MPFKKFEQNDVFYNSIKTTPYFEFKLYGDKCYINGSENYVSLKDLNLGTQYYPFIPKGGFVESFKTTTTASFSSLQYGDVVSGSYPLRSTLDLKYYYTNSTDRSYIYSLKNHLNGYKLQSLHYEFSGSFGDKSKQAMKLVSIPSIIFGSAIQKGSVGLEFYVSGTLLAKLEDIKKNGELIQTYGSSGLDNIAGVVMYNEGFVILTGSWNLDNTFTETYIKNPDGSTTIDNPKWIHWGSDFDRNPTLTVSSSYNMYFNGSNNVQTITMLAGAPKGELNHSNNPTYLQFGEANKYVNISSKDAYYESNDLKIKNTVKYKYDNYSGSLEKQTFISKIGIYDADRNLIGIAKLSKPVRKLENRDLTFKLKLDI